MARPIVVVTGANSIDHSPSGIGFGVCQRLLFQLCHTAPPDAFPQSFAVKGDPGQLVAYDGLTIVMACRSVKRAEAARTQLYECLDTYIHNLGKKPGYDGHANEFRKNVVIDIIPLDLAATATVYEFTSKLTMK
ncbi:hypothetical protein H0H93_003728 [Arthromyces matolae]|nr:hypothetical protein H0H93_003728 [Arthromyces matolae]